MDDVLLYNSALTASEVAALAARPPSNPPNADPELVGEQERPGWHPLALT